MTIEQIGIVALAQLEATHAAREQVLPIARALVRQCANTIRACQRSEWAEAAALLDGARAAVGQLRAALAARPELTFAGYTQDALKEYAEAALVYALLRGEDMPGPDELGVEAAAYLNGMAEAASELRRAILDGLRNGEVTRGEALLTQMDDIYSLCVTVDFPDAVTGGLRRTTDALRAVLERTRGDMTAALRQEQLVAALRTLEGKLA
ncbi:MAG: haloacid dehalogenase [Roseiflexaceae bacterium]|nr:haloacid dehalogenase [Roseiflexaceae bacterium]